MSALTSLSLTNVRCFEGTQQARLPRITVLVGDNSAGKSTFLGSFRALAKLTSLDDLNDENHFDEPPFGMGSFATIARSGAADVLPRSDAARPLLRPHPRRVRRGPRTANLENGSWSWASRRTGARNQPSR